MCRSYWLRRAAAMALVGLLALTAWAADKPADKAKADPPGTGPIMTQLRAQFTAWDLDKDDYLDKWELARGLRNSNTAYDGATKPKAEKGDKEKSKESPKDDDKGKTSKKPDYSRFIDYQVLTQLDKDGDERISRAEYDDWAQDYAKQIKQQIDQQNKIVQAEKKLLNNLAKKERQLLERELREEREALERLERQMNELQRRLRDQMKK